MARTYRRKKSFSNFPDYWREMDEKGRDWYRNRNPGKTDEQIVWKKCVKYHADNHPGEWNPTSAFNKGLHTKVNNKNRLNLIRCLRNDEDFVEIPMKRDSGYQYF